jgi:ribosome-binding protein aMBF1 (putative translation factor)
MAPKCCQTCGAQFVKLKLVKFSGALIYQCDECIARRK